MDPAIDREPAVHPGAGGHRNRQNLMPKPARKNDEDVGFRPASAGGKAPELLDIEAKGAQAQRAAVKPAA